MSETPIPDLACPECGTAIRRSSPRGLCSRCLVTNALVADDGPVDVSPREPEELSAALRDIEIRQFLGRGGMGTVYEAWQPSLARAVAVKVLSPELVLSEEFFERFQREARIMAQMDHPHVARVFGNGITDDGEAYIVMELVRGEPITRYAAAQRLTIRQRLDLFIQVCSGVQHAHQKGIIHRDLKPSNILVAKIDPDKIGMPKVIDFGLAKPLQHPGSDEAAWLSARQGVGTPAYMSPEQAAGGNIDSRSDIYSLGVLLFELLTGRPPFEDDSLRDASQSAVERVIRTTPVPRPSQAVAAAAAHTHAHGQNGAPSPKPAIPDLAQELRGDLDAMVLKAVAKDPARRYQTAAALSEDIERYLTYWPVSAVPAAPAYVAGKFCRRHRLGLGISAGLLLLVLTGVAALVRESVLTRRAEALAAERLRQGERLIEFMLGDLHTKLHSVGRLDVLEATVTHIEQFYERPGDTVSPESVRNRARALLQLGQIRNAQGNANAAKRHYEDAIRMYETALARRPTTIAWREELGQAWNSLAVFHHARTEWSPAETAYRQGLTIADRILQEEPSHAAWIDFKASLLQNYASLCEAVGRLSEAEQKYEQALRLWNPIQARVPDNAQLLENLSTLHQNLAFLYHRHGQTNKIHEANGEALRLRERLVALDTNDVRTLMLLADIQQNISDVHLREGNLVAAEMWIRRYLPVREQVAARDPHNAHWQKLLADARRNFAALQARRAEAATAQRGGTGTNH